MEDEEHEETIAASLDWINGQQEKIVGLCDWLRELVTYNEHLEAKINELSRDFATALRRIQFVKEKAEEYDEALPSILLLDEVLAYIEVAQTALEKTNDILGDDYLEDAEC